MSVERQWSLADRFIAVMAKIDQIERGVDNDNPHRYPIRNMKRHAEKVIFDALGSAFDIAENARVLKDEIRDLDARNQP